MPALARRPPLQAELERIAAERLAAQREIERLYRWEFIRVCGECVGWCCAGAFLMLWSFHMTDPLVAQIPFWSSMLVCYGGISFSLIAAYVRGCDRGDW
ncbi:MAG: hypothetical protein WBQ26_05585 [Gemmatimonadaceae bacterium]|nr:hypothetical protein [Gemmatimonadaceae bacterium]